MQRYDIINNIISKYNFKRYLEIGLSDPASCFDRINCEIKHSVDPGYEFLDNPATWDFESDEFFKKLDNGDLLIDSNYKWDVIFIDGLHISEQVLKDVENSLNHLTETGFIVLHDCNPPSEFMARETLYVDGVYRPWNGTVWKAVYYLRASREDLKICVVDTDWGVGIIKRGISEKIELENKFFEFKKFDLNRKKDLNLIQPEEFETWLENSDEIENNKLFGGTKIEVRKSRIHGWGVFATEKIVKEEVIEECPFIIIDGVNDRNFMDYSFNYPAGNFIVDKTKFAMCFGYGSLYNHSDNNNAYWTSYDKRGTYVFYATKDIEKDEEITVFYGGEDYWNSRSHINKK